MDIERLIRPNIRDLEPYHCAREKVQKGILLDANENPYPQKWNGIELNRYPDPHQLKLRAALADYVDVDAENVVAGAGSDEVLDWIFKVFCQPGQDQVAIAEPTYGMYRVTAQVFGVPIFEFVLDEQFDFNTRHFMDVAPAETKALFLCSPNNPTGNLLNRDEILKLCREWKRIVVVDEAYIEFSEGESLVADFKGFPNLIILRTLSKAFGRAALRLGYAVASAQIVSYFLKVKAPYNLNSLTLDQGLQAFKNPGLAQQQIAEIRRERRRVRARLRDVPAVKEVFPSQANFLLFRCEHASEVCERLLEKGIVVRNRSSGARIDNCIRVTIGTPEENDLFLNELQNVAERIQ